MYSKWWANKHKMELVIYFINITSCAYCIILLCLLCHCESFLNNEITITGFIGMTINWMFRCWNVKPPTWQRARDGGKAGQNSWSCHTSDCQRTDCSISLPASKTHRWQTWGEREIIKNMDEMNEKICSYHIYNSRHFFKY